MRCLRPPTHLYNSCRNRHCPKCQSLARAEWLEHRRSELLAVPYFHVVFTVPQQIAAIAHYNKGPVYDILFHAAAETLQTIATDPKHLGAELGFFAVLHTWGQTLLMPVNWQISWHTIPRPSHRGASHRSHRVQGGS
jgi:hypothetical protein